MQKASSSTILQPRARRGATAALFWLAACNQGWSAEAGPAATELKLTSEQAHCLAKNSELMIRQKGDPVVFYFDLCLAEQAAQGSSRLSLPDLPTPVQPIPGAKADEMRPDSLPIKVSKAFLRCIQTKKATTPAFLDTNPVVLSSAVCQP